MPSLTNSLLKRTYVRDKDKSRGVDDEGGHFRVFVKRGHFLTECINAFPGPVYEHPLGVHKLHKDV